MRQGVRGAWVFVLKQTRFALVARITYEPCWEACLSHARGEGDHTLALAERDTVCSISSMVEHTDVCYVCAVLTRRSFAFA